MKSLMMVAVLALTVAAQTSKPAEEFQLWKPTEVGKQLDEFISKNEQMNKDLAYFAGALQRSKVAFSEDRKLEILIDAQDEHERYSKYLQAKETKDGAKKFGIDVDGVFFYYSGSIELPTDTFTTKTVGMFRYWNSTDREILGIKVYHTTITDIFGDVTTVSEKASGTSLSGSESEVVDCFDRQSPVFASPINKSMKTARLTDIKVKIVFKPKSK